MSNRNNEYDERLGQCDRTENISARQRQTTLRPGRYLSPKRMSAKRRKTRQRRIALFAVAVLAIVILIIVSFCKGCSNGKEDLSALSGVWHYDQYTEYEFDGEGKGCMCLDGNSHYEFTYTVKEGSLKLDFQLDYVTDCEYTYTVDGNKLTLVGGKGTAEVGKVYELTKVQ